MTYDPLLTPPSPSDDDRRIHHVNQHCQNSSLYILPEIEDLHQIMHSPVNMILRQLASQGLRWSCSVHEQCTQSAYSWICYRPNTCHVECNSWCVCVVHWLDEWIMIDPLINRCMLTDWIAGANGVLLELRAATTNNDFSLSSFPWNLQHMPLTCSSPTCSLGHHP